jgi:pyruvate dehydrogenase E2 component (dihydrolipoamide acetyltransferase)
MIEFKMPSLGADMDSGTLSGWHIKPGDHVNRGDIVADVETQKGTIEVEIWDSGTVSELIVKSGEHVPVGTVLALVQAEGDAAARPQPSQPVSQPQAETEISPAPTKAVAPGPARQQRLRVTPLARKLAGEHKIDLAHVHGSGPHGAIVRADIEALIAKPATRQDKAIPAATEIHKKTSAMRQAIAAAMSRSNREIPHYYLQSTFSMKQALNWLEQRNESRPATKRLLPAALYLKAVAKACHRIPEMNGFWLDGEFHPSSAVHIGMGISLRQGGLIAPAIHDVDQKNIEQLMNDLMDLVGRVRAGKIRSSEMSDATITVTSMGDQGVETVFGVIYPPQVALVGFGRTVDRPWHEGQLLGVMPVVTATLSADHRASDGHRGGQFLNYIETLLSDPETLEGDSNG